MEESFELLSSMSPKVDKTRKMVKKTKGPTILSLKKSIRKSAIFDKLPYTSVNNAVVDTISSTDSVQSSNKDNPIEVILIPDSEDEACDNPSSTAFSNRKLDLVKKWVDNIDTDGIVHESEEWELTQLSQISSIQGDGKRNGDNCIVNSTFLNQSDNLKDLFTNFGISKTKNICNNAHVEKKKQEKQIFKETKEFNNFSNMNERNLKNIIKKKMERRKDSFESVENSFEEKKGSDVDDFVTVKDNFNGLESNNDSNKNYYDTPGTPANAHLDYQECKSVLDELYGNSWRKNKDKVLPKSEQGPRKKKSNLKQCPNTEIKINNAKKNHNQYLDSEVKKSKNLFKTLQSARMKAALESPWLSKLSSLCDPESSEDEKENRNDFKNIKTKLKFDDLETDSYSKSSNNSSNKNLDINKYRSRKSSTSSTSSCDKTQNRKGSLSSSSKNSDWIDDDFSDDCQLSLKDKLKERNLKTKEKKPAGQKTKSLQPQWNDEINDSLEEKLKNKLIIKHPSTEPIKRTKSKSETPKTQSFLASLSKIVPDSQCDASARIFRNNFKHYRDQLVTKLFKLYNDEIFANCLPDDTPIEWSDRMTGTAGYCSCVKITRRTGVIERKVKLKLATKILDSADRLRDTLVHEMCHAATWIVNKVSDGHGCYWKSWAGKAMKVFPELPPIKRCHDYAINTKYTYRCTGCGYSVGRHSKSLDLDRKRCGHCYGTFEVLINKTSKSGETKSVPVKTRGASGFALFVKENYKDYKCLKLDHKEVMKILGQKYKEINVKQTE